MTTSLESERHVHGVTRTADRNWVHVAGRVGIASRGVIYLVLSYLAFDIARHGNAPAQTSSTGALLELEARPGGKLLLIVLALGLASYAGWRFFNAVTGSSGAVKRLSSLAIGIIYAALCIRAVELIAGHPTSGGASSNPEPWIARVMGWSGGTLAVELVGAALIGAGVGLGAWGCLHRYERDLALERLAQKWRILVKALGGLGDAARGILLALVGIYAIDAAASSNPSQAKSVDQALRALVHHPFGALAIGLIALGLMVFGLFSFSDACLRRL